MISSIKGDKRMRKEETVEMISKLNTLIYEVNSLNVKCMSVVYPPVRFELHEAQSRLETCKDMMKKELKECSNWKKDGIQLSKM